MNRLQELWTRLNGEGDPLTDEELAELAGLIRESAAAIDVANATDEDMEALREARDMSQHVTSVQEARAAEAAAAAAEREQRAEEARQILAEIAPGTADGGEGGEGEGGEGSGEGDAATGGAGEGGETAAGAPRVPSISHLAARQPPPRQRPDQAVAQPRPTLLASADMPGLQAGTAVTVDEWADAAERRIDALMKVRASGAEGEKVYLGKIDATEQYPEQRFLRTGQVEENSDKVQAVLDRTEPIAAAGGICGPVGAVYDLTGISSADRPGRDGMVQFGADRGGVRFVLPHTLASVTAKAPSQVWTQATDANPGQSTKAHATFVCQTPNEVYVDAITSIVQFGNFQARYFPEQIRQFLDEVDAVHARLAEATLLGAMLSDSSTKTVNAGNNGTNQTGAATELFAELGRAAAHARYVHRMARGARLQFWYPAYLEDMLRADIARELPGGTIDERLAIAQAQINAWFDAINVDPVVFIDSPTGASVLQGWADQVNGDLQGWPTKVLTFLTHPGAWTFLDGGELNLGMIRDSVLNATNDFQMFSETFERAVFRGHFNWAMLLDLCAFGGRAATVDTSTLCTTGS